MTPNTSFSKNMALNLVLVIEPGPLEWQVEYLLRSVRRYGQIPEATLWVVSPRNKSLRPASYTFLEAQEINYVEADLNPTWGFHPLSNKVFAACYVEERVDGPLLFLDSDILVFGSLQSLAVEPGIVRVKPAHNSFAAAHDYTDDFWYPLFKQFAISPGQTWTSVATGEVEPTLAYYNTGVIAAHSRDRLFRRWAESYEKLPALLPSLFDELQGFEHLPPYHRKTRRQKQLYHIGQILFALTLFAHYSPAQIEPLPVSYNYPLPKHAQLGRQRLDSLDKITLLHYHRELRDPFWFTRFEVSPARLKWLITTLYGEHADN